MRHGNGYYGSRRYDPPTTLIVQPHGAGVPTPQAQADCVRIMADPSATLDELTAARTVASCAANKTVPPLAHVMVLKGYMGRQLDQNRWGK